MKEIVRKYHPLSIKSCYLRMFFNDTFLASGTCFFIKSAKGIMLITNRHNFTGRNNFSNSLLDKKYASVPNNAVVILPANIGQAAYYIDLYNPDDESKPSWVEHPVLGNKADVVALPCKELSNAISKNNSVELGTDWYETEVGRELNVIGYPFGRVSGPFAVWSKGYVATEISFDVGKLPVFLIDCRARPGQSGSPVYTHFKKGDVLTYDGKDYQAKNDMYYFLGVYSGRLRADSDLGIVWNRTMLQELVEYADKCENQHIMDNRRIKIDASSIEEFSFQNVINDINF